MEVYYNALLELSLKVPGEFIMLPKENSPVKAWSNRVIKMEKQTKNKTKQNKKKTTYSITFWCW